MVRGKFQGKSILERLKPYKFSTIHILMATVLLYGSSGLYFVQQKISYITLCIQLGFLFVSKKIHSLQQKHYAQRSFAQDNFPWFNKGFHPEAPDRQLSPFHVHWEVILSTVWSFWQSALKGTNFYLFIYLLLKVRFFLGCTLNWCQIQHLCRFLLVCLALLLVIINSLVVWISHI